jgi:hypothetical protein
MQQMDTHELKHVKKTNVAAALIDDYKQSKQV